MKSIKFLLRRKVSEAQVQKFSEQAVIEKKQQANTAKALADIKGPTGSSSDFRNILVEYDTYRALQQRDGRLPEGMQERFSAAHQQLRITFGEKSFIQVYDAWNRARSVREASTPQG